MFWNICDDYYIQFIFLTVSKALAVFLSIIIYLHHRTILNKNNWSPITTTNIRTYYKFISIKFCQKLFSYTKKEEHCEFIYIGRLFEGEVLECIPSSLWFAFILSIDCYQDCARVLWSPLEGDTGVFNIYADGKGG